LTIQEIEETFNVVDLHARTAMQVTRDNVERFVISGATHAAANSSVHHFAVGTPGLAAFPGKGFSDVIVQGERCPVRHIMKYISRAS
jgi:hypothetical protein